jgi:outer membrane protein
MRAQTFFLSIILASLSISGIAQNKTWSLDECINHALENNIQVKQANLSAARSEVQASQSRDNRLPSVSASVRQNLNWSKSLDMQTNSYGNLSGSNSTNYSVSSSVTLFNGFRLQNAVKQSEINVEADKLYAETVKESVELNVMNAFLQVIYAEEQLKNAEKQLESTTEQLALAQARFELSAISRSDLLQIESQVASEKLTLVNAQKQLSMSKVNLQQLMELPVSDTFAVVSPNIDALIKLDASLTAAAIYETALKLKPQIGEAKLNIQSAEMDTKIAQAAALPSLSMDAGIGTGYSSLNSNFNYANQLNNSISPSVGLTLSIPIFQKNQVKNNVALAKIGVDNATLSELNTRNQLRKEIEQAYTDAVSAQTQYEASIDQLKATSESYKVAEEKFKLGALNSVDFLFEKTKLISAESQLLQSKFNLVFSNKIVDFYNNP